MRALSGSGSALLGSGAAGVILLHQASARALTIGGSIAVLAGMGLALPMLWAHSLGGFIVATMVAGLGMGLNFQGAIRSVVSVSAPSERAGVLSVAFVVSYVAMGLPGVRCGGDGLCAACRDRCAARDGSIVGPDILRNASACRGSSSPAVPEIARRTR